MELLNRNVLVFGSGKSGIGACRLLESHGARVILYDRNEKLNREELREQLGENSKAEIILGAFPQELINSLELVVMSPGVPTDLPVVLGMKEQGIPVWGEIELGYTLGRGDVLAITGTNGKTTTTTLLGQIMKADKESVFVVGNIGNPYTCVADRMRDDTVTVAEISSFQLETIDRFRPKVSAILNITPDHLNRHHTMENYIRTKEEIARNQTGEDTCVLNYEDEILRAFGETIKDQVNILWFSSQSRLPKGIYLENGNIIYKGSDKSNDEVMICRTDELKLQGTHNYENVMAAAAMAAAYGVPMETIRRVVKAFGGVEHRNEFVCEKNGVAYYNDSKGTNPDASIQAVRAMKRPTCLIGGGYDKASEFDEWIDAFEGKIKKLVLIGATREKIAETAVRHGYPTEDIILSDTFEDAVKACVRHAEPGDAVLLSPACASWGMFSNYEERGDKFKELVNAL